VKAPAELCGEYFGGVASIGEWKRLEKLVAARDAEHAAQLATARTQAHAAGRLDGELSGLAQGLAVATGDGALWLRQRYRAVEAVVAVIPVDGEVKGGE
jgi:hypothetical protein